MENTISFEPIQQGNQDAFEKLFHSYYDRLRRFAFFYLKDKIQSEEIVEELFIHLWEKRGQLHIGNLELYLFASVKNRSINALKKNRYIFLPLADFESSLIAEGQQPDRQVLHAESEQEVLKLLGYLPEKRRLIFVLSRIDGLKYQEIAQLMQISIRTVEDQVFKAVKILRELVGKKREDNNR